eukprot:761843-Hanusia_phi.AAC.1
MENERGEEVGEVVGGRWMTVLKGGQQSNAAASATGDGRQRCRELAVEEDEGGGGGGSRSEGEMGMRSWII